MKTRETHILAPESPTIPDEAELAALRAWYAGLEIHAAVSRYLAHEARPAGASSRGILGRIRRQLIDFAKARHRPDLAAIFTSRPSKRSADTVPRAIETLRQLPLPVPQVTDAVETWLSPRTVRALHAHGIRTLSDLTVRIPRRRRWWLAIEGLGIAGARHVEAFFAAHTALTERAQALIVAAPTEAVTPWEHLRVPHDVDGSRGLFRAPRSTSLLDASNDYEAVQTWLSLHESLATQRAYRKEAERLMLWTIVERGRALSSLTTDDAIAYRAFLRRLTPRARWVGPSRPRHSPEWRPFTGALSAHSAAYALNVLSALFRWLVEQRYLLANPFADVRIKRQTGRPGLDVSRGFSEGEWLLIRSPMVSNGPAVGASWLVPPWAMSGQANKGSIGCMSSAKAKSTARWHCHRWLAQYLLQRGLPVTPVRWDPGTPLVVNLEEDGAHIESTRLWRVIKRFFGLAADAIQNEWPATAEKLRRASPHWIRHPHASHALACGAELVMVRDNLRHASVSTTSTYLHSDEIQRARQMNHAFAVRK